MKDRFTIKLFIKGLLLLFLLSTQAIFAARSTKWQKRFIQSTESGTVATVATLPSDSLTCANGVIKLNKNMDTSTDTTEVINLTFPITKHGASAAPVKCAPYGFYRPSTGETMNSGSISATCYDGHFSVTSNCKVASNSTCSIANGAGVQIFDPATDSLGACQVSSCNGGYSSYQNQCIASAVACSIANGTGYNYFNGAPYSACTVASCNSGYSNVNNQCVVSIQSCGGASFAAAQNGRYYLSNGAECTLPSGCTTLGVNGSGYYCKDPSDCEYGFFLLMGTYHNSNGNQCNMPSACSTSSTYNNIFGALLACPSTGGDGSYGGSN